MFIRILQITLNYNMSVSTKQLERFNKVEKLYTADL